MRTQTWIMTSYQQMLRHGFHKIVVKETKANTNKKFALLLAELVPTE